MTKERYSDMYHSVEEFLKKKDNLAKLTTYYQEDREHFPSEENVVGNDEGHGHISARNQEKILKACMINPKLFEGFKDLGDWETKQSTNIKQVLDGMIMCHYNPGYRQLFPKLPHGKAWEKHSDESAAAGGDGMEKPHNESAVGNENAWQCQSCDTIMPTEFDHCSTCDLHKYTFYMKYLKYKHKYLKYKQYLKQL